mmetsp:Transcript_5296/g.12638  ORF Transcript_5296/g.12638 Transcript_5296/m.12638 type:complete len:260 (+) Transcript_5296:91-870(+)
MVPLHYRICTVLAVLGGAMQLRPPPLVDFLSMEEHSMFGQLAPEKCRILDGWWGYLVQGLLFFVCFGSLILKRQMEIPQRTWLVFFLDSSKQIAGATVIHILNMVCAWYFADMEGATADECAWYWINIMIDTTVGVLICWGLLKVTEKLFGYDSGHYGKGASTGIDWEKDPDYGTWLHQILIWCAIVCTMKAIVVLIMWLYSAEWEVLAILATHWIEDRKMRLLFVMLITPTVMNIFQFWAQDAFLKFQGTVTTTEVKV